MNSSDMPVEKLFYILKIISTVNGIDSNKKLYDKVKSSTDLGSVIT